MWDSYSAHLAAAQRVADLHARADARRLAAAARHAHGDGGPTRDAAQHHRLERGHVMRYRDAEAVHDRAVGVAQAAELQALLALRPADRPAARGWPGLRQLARRLALPSGRPRHQPRLP